MCKDESSTLNGKLPLTAQCVCVFKCTHSCGRLCLGVIRGGTSGLPLTGLRTLLCTRQDVTLEYMLQTLLTHCYRMMITCRDSCQGVKWDAIHQRCWSESGAVLVCIFFRVSLHRPLWAGSTAPSVSSPADSSGLAHSPPSSGRRPPPSAEAPSHAGGTSLFYWVVHTKVEVPNCVTCFFWGAGTRSISPNRSFAPPGPESFMNDSEALLPADRLTCLF